MIRSVEGTVCAKPVDDPIDVLVVEDSVELAEMYAFVLRARGFTAEIAHTTIDAWGCIADLSPRLILLDIDLGGDSGLDILEELARRGGGCPEVPILIFTNSESAEHRRRAHDAGATGYLIKANVRPARLVETVRAALDRPQPATS